MGNKVTFTFTFLDKFSKVSDKLRKSNDKVTRSVAKLGEKSKSVSAKLGRAFSRMKQSFRKLAARAKASAATVSKAFKKMGLSARGAALSIVAGFALGFIAVKKFVDSGDSLAKWADSLGVSVKAMQRLQFAADRSGVSAEQFRKGIAQFSVTLGNAKAANKGLLNSFLKETNPGLLKILKNTNSTEKAFALLSDAIANETDANKRAALASAAFGKTNLGMINVMKLGSKEIKRLGDLAERLGIVLSRKTLKAAEDAQDKFTDLKAVWLGATNTLIAELLPSIIQITDSLIGLIMSVKDSVLIFKKWTEDNPVLTDTLITVGKAIGAIVGVLILIKAGVIAFNVVLGIMNLLLLPVTGTFFLIAAGIIAVTTLIVFLLKKFGVFNTVIEKTSNFFKALGPLFGVFPEDAELTATLKRKLETSSSSRTDININLSSPKGVIEKIQSKSEGTTTGLNVGITNKEQL